MGKYNSRLAHPRANPNLSNLTFNISDDILDGLAYGISRGWWATRSDGARVVMQKGLNFYFREKIEMKEKIEELLETNLDPSKKYVNIPDRGYIEIIGEA